MYSLLTALALVVLVLLATTANVAIRHFSRGQLVERLDKRGRGELLNRLTVYRSELLFGTSLVRMSAILALVLLVSYLFNSEFIAKAGIPPLRLFLDYSAIFLIGMMLVMLFGVAIPNAWARYGGEALLACILPVLLLLHYVLYPLTLMQSIADALVRRLAGVPKADEQQNEADQIGQEILDVVSEGELAGTVHEEDADMIESVMEFRATDVGKIMTPRTEIIALPQTATRPEARELIRREGHSRIPIYGESIDEIKGVLYAKDLLGVEDRTPFDLLQIMRKVPFVPETKRVGDLLKELREQKVHLAVVLDEYGGTAGLVTIEDIVEEIVGEIADEYETPEPEPIRRLSDRIIEVDARVHIDELNDELHLEFPENEDYDTIGGLIFSQMGRIPSIGEEFHYGNIKFVVIDAEERKINRLRLEILEQKEGRSNVSPSGSSGP